MKDSNTEYSIEPNPNGGIRIKRLQTMESPMEEINGPIPTPVNIIVDIISFIFKMIVGLE